MNLLGKGGLLEDIKLCLKITDFGGGLPFQWNETSNQLEKKSKNKLYNLGFRLGLATLGFMLELVQTYRVFDGASLMVITHTIMYVTSGFLMLCTELVNYGKLSSVVQLFNSFIQLEENFEKYFGNQKVVDGQMTVKTDRVVRYMIYFLTCTGAIYPFIYAADILRNPCFPAYAGYWLSSQCEDGKAGLYLEPTWSYEEVLTKVGLSLATYVVWAPFIGGWLFIMSLEYVLEGHCFRVDIAEFGKTLLRVPSDNIRDLRKLAIFYRQLQIMTIHYRRTLSQFQIGCTIPCLIAVQTACLNNSFSLISGKVLGGPIWYNLLYVWAEVTFFFLVIFVFGLLADVHTTSAKVQGRINGRYDLKRNKWFKRWTKSCPVLKIYFGGSNFLDRLTPLNIQDFAINQTVSLMLLQD